MKKLLGVLGLLSILSQPVMAQCYSTGTPVFRQVNVTGGAVAIPTCQMQPTCTAVPTGMAVPIQFVPYSACPCTTGGAANVTPTMVPVVVPKKHFWQRSRVEYQPIVTPTGGAAPVCPNLCPVAPVTQPNCIPACPTNCPNQ